MKFLVVFNPVANRQRQKRLQQLVSFLKRKNVTHSLYPTDKNLALTKHYFDRHLDEYTDLIVVGGDGTFHQIVNCIAQNTKIRVGLLPAGTGNDFARWLYGNKITNLDSIFHTLISKNVTSIKLGCCEFADSKKRYFHNVLGFGFDALLAKELKDNKGLFSKLGYIGKAIQRIPFYREQAVHVVIDNKDHKYHNLITAVANHQFFGNGMKIVPDSLPIDEHLGLCRIEKLPLLTKFSHILRLFNGSHVKKGFVDHRTISGEVEIVTNGVDIEADGEYLGLSPAKIYAVNNAISIKRITSF